VFTNSGGNWSQQAELSASDGAAGDWFGDSVALSGDGNTAVLGASGHAVNGNQIQGAAYVFTNSAGSWSQQAELTASDGVYDDEFGISVRCRAMATRLWWGVVPHRQWEHQLSGSGVCVRELRWKLEPAAGADSVGWSGW